MTKETLRDLGLLGLRVSLALMMLLAHGWPKVGRLFAPGEVKFGDPIGLGPTTSLVLAIGAEVGCSLLVALGLFTRVAVAPLVVTMAVAAFVVHADDPWSKQEFALLYLVPFLALGLTGPGRFSLDAVLDARKPRGAGAGAAFAEPGR